MFTDDMTVYVENSKEFTKKQNLHERNTRIQDQYTSTVFLYYTGTEQPKNEI